MVVLGAIVGAGFASGREVVSFFGKYGYYGLFLIIPVFALFFFCFYIFSKLGKAIKPKSISDFTNAMFGRASVFVDCAFILATFITLSSMLAGSDSIGQITFGASYNFCYISVVTTMITTILVFYGIKYIYKITDAILPVILTIILATIFVFLIFIDKENVANVNLSNNGFEGIIYAILYVFMNTFSNIFIIGKSSIYMQKRHIKSASIISSLVLSIFIGLIIITVLSGGNEIFLSDMPMLMVANSIGGWFGYIYAFVLWLAIFTTICIASYTIVEWLNTYIKSKFMCAVVTLTLAFIFSRFGFAKIVDIFYPIEGIFGGLFIIYSIIFYFKNKAKFLAVERKNLVANSFAESKNLSQDSSKFNEMFLEIENLDHQNLQNDKNKENQNLTKNNIKTSKNRQKNTKKRQNYSKNNKIEDLISIKITKQNNGIVKEKKYKRNQK